MFLDAIELSKRRCKYPIRVCLAYGTRENFLGRVVDGYKRTDLCLLSPKTAAALCNVQNDVNELGLGVFVFDAYRPLRAVKDFAHWAKLPITNPYEEERQKLHYPNLKKEDLSPNYVADTVSGHCFGNVVDLSFVSLHSNKLLNMGAIFDYFDPIAHHNVPKEIIGEEAVFNRELLLKLMEKHGFDHYPYEYWHYSYREKELDTPIDIEIV